jgi:hypothetical protein
MRLHCVACCISDYVLNMIGKLQCNGRTHAFAVVYLNSAVFRDVTQSRLLNQPMLHNIPEDGAIECDGFLKFTNNAHRAMRVGWGGTVEESGEAVHLSPLHEGVDGTVNLSHCAT